MNSHLIDGHGVRHSVAGVEHNTGGTSGRVEREDGLDGDVHGGGVERLEHDLGHLLAVRLGVQGSLGQQNGVLLRRNAELVVESVVPVKRGKKSKKIKKISNNELTGRTWAATTREHAKGMQR